MYNLCFVAYVRIMVIALFRVREILVGEPIVSFQDVAFLQTKLAFPPHFLITVVEVKALGPPHILGLWLVV